MIIYLAGSLFTMAERDFNTRLANALRERLPQCRIIVPQEECEVAIRNGRPWRELYDICVDRLDQADCVVAILDGPDVDSGTCVELGYAAARGKRILGFRTDSRASEDRGVNLMVANTCDEFIRLTPDVPLSALVDEITLHVTSFEGPACSQDRQTGGASPV